MFLKIIGIELMTFIILNLDITSAKIPTYKDVCDYVIKIGTEDHAAKLSFHYNPSSSPRVCNISIETLDGYQTHGGYHYIAYTFLDSGVENNFRCTSHIYYDNEYTSGYYCGNNVYPQVIQITRYNRLFLTVVGDTNTKFVFNMLFMSFHNGSCANYETRCKGLLGDSNAGTTCVDNSLVCSETYTFCGESGARCSDIPSSGSNDSVVTIIVVTVVLVLFVGLTFFLCHKKECFGLLKRSDSDDVRTRAMHIFSLQYANRGADGNENAAATDDEGNPIDFSKFDPPPEYGSLEHLDNVGLTETNGGVTETDGSANPDEVLPSYGDVMKNFDEYTITTQI